MLDPAQLERVSKHIVEKWKEPCPTCGAKNSWGLDPADLFVMPAISSPDHTLAALIVGCTSCGFIALLYPALADPQGWAEAAKLAKAAGEA